MNYFEQFSELTSLVTVASWRDRVYKFANDFGYENIAVVFFDETSKDEPYFLQTNYPSTWRDKYIEENMVRIDPVFMHCLTKSIPCIWAETTFSGVSQKGFYEEACSYGIRTGVSLPARGPNNAFGAVSFATDAKPDRVCLEQATRNIPELSCFRDFIFETSLQLIRPAVSSDEKAIALTQRELECLKWSASGKSSWDIAYILNCTEAGINSHFSRIRQKMGVSTRRQAIVKAIRLELINPA